jgi:hypothetical protein
MEPEAVRQTSGLLQRLTSAGKTRAAIKLAAKIDPKNADQGIRAIQQKLKQFDLPSKKVKLSAEPTGFNKTLKSVTGSPGKKDIKLGVSNLGQIKSTLQGWVDDTPTKNIKITPQLTDDTVTVYVDKVPVKAAGGMIGTAKQEGSRTQGGRFAAPTFLVGEENRPEYVIATNPAYRRDNIQYWMEAGMALGIPGFKDGGKNGNDKSGGNKKLSIADLTKRYRKLEAKISWSEREAGVTRSEQDNNLAKGIPVNNNAIVSDAFRTLGLQKSRRKTLNQLVNKYKQAIKDAKTEKKKKKLQQESQEFRQADAQAGLAVREAKADWISAKNDRDVGAGFGIAPGLQQLITGQSEIFATRSAYSSNVGAGSMGTIGTAGMNFLGGRYDTESAASVTPRRSGKTVNITNNYQEPPADPHTWSKDLAWEMSVS